MQSEILQQLDSMTVPELEALCVEARRRLIVLRRQNQGLREAFERQARHAGLSAAEVEILFGGS